MFWPPRHYTGMEHISDHDLECYHLDEEKYVLVPGRPIRLRQSGHLVHNRRRSHDLGWFPQCSPAQIVDHLASKIVIQQVCRRGERPFESVQIGWSRFASISPGGQDA